MPELVPVSQSETRYWWERTREVIRVRSSRRKQTHHDRTTFVQRTVPSTDAPVGIWRNRDTMLVRCLERLHPKHCGVRSHLNHNCRWLDVRQYQLCCPRINPQKYLGRTFPTFPRWTISRCGRDMDGYINRPSDTKPKLCNLYLCKFNTGTFD